MTYLEHWQNIKNSVIAIDNIRPYYIIYSKEEVGQRKEVIEEIINDYNSMNISWSKNVENLKDLWKVMDNRNSLVFRSPESRLEYATFLSEPIVLNKFILVGINILEVDLEEPETTLTEIRVYLK